MMAANERADGTRAFQSLAALFSISNFCNYMCALMCSATLAIDMYRDTFDVSKETAAIMRELCSL